MAEGAWCKFFRVPPPWNVLSPLVTPAYVRVPRTRLANLNFAGKVGACGRLQENRVFVWRSFRPGHVSAAHAATKTTEE